MPSSSSLFASLRARAWRAGTSYAQSRWRWDVGAALFFFVVSTFVYAIDPSSHAPGSDGHYSWIYARSLAYDGDFDFANDYALCGDPFGIGWPTRAHRPANIFYFGPAVVWTPVIWVLKHFVHATDPKVAGACVGPIPLVVLILSSVAGAGLVALTSAVARRFVGPKTAALGALLTALGGHVLLYTALNPSYSHAYDALCVAAYVYFVVRAREHPERARYARLAGLFFALAILQRSINAAFFVFAVACLFRARPTETLRRSLVRLTEIGAIGLALGIVPLALIEHSVSGKYQLYAHGPHFLHMGHAHPLLLIFDERGGFFAGAPVLWLCVPGLFLAMRRHVARWFAAPLLAIGAFECYVSAAALDWQGARRLLNLAPLVTLTACLAIAHAKRWLAGRPERIWIGAGLATVLLVGWRNAAVCFAFAHGKIPYDTPLPASVRYGDSEKAALSAIEADVGSPAVFPAAWIFAARYGLGPAGFGEGIHPRWYARDFHTLAYQLRGLTFTATEARGIESGLRSPKEDSGACFEGLRAKAVFAAQWPFATRARLTFDATRPQTLAVRSRTFWGKSTEWPVESQLVPGQRQQVILRIPPGGFDSGVNELLFERGGTDGDLCLHRIDFADDTRYPDVPPAEAGLRVLWWPNDRYEESGAAAPSLAVGSSASGPWAVEVHETGSRLTYGAGRDGNPQNRALYEQRGFRPRVVAASAGGSVIEVHQGEPGPGPLLYRRGEFHGNDQGATVAWAGATTYGVGYHPAIAALDGRVVEAHMASADAGPLSFRVGSYAATGAIAWSEEQIFESAGANPALAIAPAPAGAPGTIDSDGESARVLSARGPIVLEVHQQNAKFGALWYRTGRLDSAGAVSWGPRRQYDSGVNPRVVIYGGRAIEVHQGQDDVGGLWFESGPIGADGVIAWEGAVKFDEGASPDLAIDPLRGEGMESHQGQVSAGSLWRRPITAYR